MVRPFRVQTLMLGLAFGLGCVNPADLPSVAAAENSSAYQAIEVTDEVTGRGVPLVQLETVDRQKFVTDSAGHIAVPMEPGLVGKPVWFTISSYGYEYPQKSFGIAGLAIELKSGGKTQIKLKRTNIAERLYRITGRGIYRDTVLLGKRPPVIQASDLPGDVSLPGSVVGQDSVQVAQYRGQLYWFWGDTARPGHPLGNFFTTGAVGDLLESKPGEKSNYDPAVGVPFTYFIDEKSGFVRPMAKFDRAEPLPVWIDGLCVVEDRNAKNGNGKAAKRQRMLTRFTRVKDLKPVESGLMVWDDATEKFQFQTAIPVDAALVPAGHALRASEGGTEYIYFAFPYPLVRVKNDWKSAIDLASYEGFTCLKTGTKLEVSETKLNRDVTDRDDKGQPIWKWRKATPPLTEKEIVRLAKSPGPAISREGSPYQLRDAKTGKPIELHYSSVFWNAHRQRFVMIGVQQHGSSYLGEIWYSEAFAPEGPWRDAVKVATHAAPPGQSLGNMSFYNPRQHPEFSNIGKYIYFEGTYTNTFANNPLATPLYEYNQIMYRLDLTDPRLKLPEPPPGFTHAKPSRLGS